MDSIVRPVGAKIKHGSIHNNADGCGIHSIYPKDKKDGAECTCRLIYTEWTRDNEMANEYDKWRSVWCNKNRNAKTPEGLREGKITPETVEFAISKGYKPAFTIEQLSQILNMEVHIDGTD